MDSSSLVGQSAPSGTASCGECCCGERAISDRAHTDALPHTHTHTHTHRHSSAAIAAHVHAHVGESAAVLDVARRRSSDAGSPTPDSSRLTTPPPEEDAHTSPHSSLSLPHTHGADGHTLTHTHASPGSEGEDGGFRSRLSTILTFNSEFVAKRDFEKYRRPHAHTGGKTRALVITCMDTRLIHLLPHAMDFHSGDAKIIKNAGAIVSHPFGGIMRSVVVALFELNCDEIFVVGHHDCGMAKVNPAQTVKKMVSNGGIKQETISLLGYAGINIERWLHGFDSVYESVSASVATIRNHPLVPAHVPVHGLIVDPNTGKLDLVVDGNEAVVPRLGPESAKPEAATLAGFHDVPPPAGQHAATDSGAAAVPEAPGSSGSLPVHTPVARLLARERPRNGSVHGDGTFSQLYNAS